MLSNLDIHLFLEASALQVNGFLRQRAALLQVSLLLYGDIGTNIVVGAGRPWKLASSHYLLRLGWCLDHVQIHRSLLVRLEHLHRDH